MTPHEDALAPWTDALRRLEADEVLTGPSLGGLLALDGDGFGSRTLGLVWDRLTRRQGHAHLEVDERHRQPAGIVHGGVWCAVVESMASVAGAVHASGRGRVVVGVHNATDFLRSHREGRVDGVVTPVHLGRSQHLWQVDLARASDGRAVARGQVRLAVIDPTTLS